MEAEAGMEVTNNGRGQGWRGGRGGGDGRENRSRDREVEWCSGAVASGFEFIELLLHIARKFMRST